MRLGLLLAIMLALLGLTSCGGNESLTESEYRAAGNELCADWSNKIGELAAEAADGSEQDIIDFTTEAGRVADDYTERLLDLSTPESMAIDRAAIQDRIAEFDALVASGPETEDDFGAITDAGDAISDALGNIWSACRSR